MKKKPLLKRISRVFFSFLVVLFMISCKEKYPFDLSENAQIIMYDDDNIFSLEKIITDEDKLIYMFNKENDLLNVDKINELSQEKKYDFVLLGENSSISNVGYKIIEEDGFYYLFFKYDEKESNDEMLGFKINVDREDESFSIYGIDNPHLSYWNYSGEYVNYRGIDEWVYGSTIYEEYDSSKKEWVNYGKNYISSYDEPR